MELVSYLGKLADREERRRMGQNPDQDCIAYITKMIGRPGDW